MEELRSWNNNNKENKEVGIIIIIKRNRKTRNRRTIVRMLNSICTISMQNNNSVFAFSKHTNENHDTPQELFLLVELA